MVSVFPIYDLTRRVAGPDADVVLLLAPGRSEHTFDPTPRDIEAAASSQLGVMVGLGLDPWMEKLVRDAAPKARLVQLGNLVPTIAVRDDFVGDMEEDHDDHEHHHEQGGPDPHVWLDPNRAAVLAIRLGDELAAVDPVHAEGYRARAQGLSDALLLLDKEVLEHSQAWKGKPVVTFHGSFGYFADRYGLRIVAVIEPLPGATPTGSYVLAVLKVVRDKHAVALFSEPQLDARPAEILAREAKIPLGVLDPVGGGSDTDSYEKMTRFNVAALDRVLR